MPGEAKLMQFDVAVVGGGPIGLALAASLSGAGLAIAVVDKQAEAALAAPAFDGRETALTHLSRRILQDLGAWARLPPEDISPLREARVLNGDSAYALRFDAAGQPEAELGNLVPNHRIRAALFQVARQKPDVRLFTGLGVTAAKAGRDGCRVTLSDGTALSSRLLVAADSRLSELRGRLGIAAEVNRSDAAMLVCRVDHDGDHHHTATECFDHGQTIATLPMNGRSSSLVLTLPRPAIERLCAMPPDAFNEEATRRTRRRLGAMRLASTRHIHPLATCYARRFAGPRCALVGDAAVGMNPMTAHGFNLGLRGQDTLAGLVRAACAQGGDIAAADLLGRYERAHRRATWPLYAGTNLLAKLYAGEGLAARLARPAALRLANNLPLFKDTVRSILMENAPRPTALAAR